VQESEEMVSGKLWSCMTSLLPAKVSEYMKHVSLKYWEKQILEIVLCKKCAN